MNPIIHTFLTIHGVITYITLCNTSGASVTLSSLGAGIVSVNVPDRNGIIADVALGYESPESYYNDGPTMGKIPGRYANRIGYGRFPISGDTIQLPVNLPPHTLHGGFETGIHNKFWTVTETTPDKVVFSLVSPDGDAGFPGELTLTVTYRWSEDNVLSIDMKAVTDKPTVINLTSHAYFNLGGASSGTALDTDLKINASRYLETDSTLLPSGRVLDVKNTPMDFTTTKKIGRDIKAEFPPLKFANGYDHCFVVDNPEPGTIVPVAVAVDTKSGRRLDIFSDQPAVQLYTANWMAGTPVGKHGKPYADYDGFALEPQDFPDAPNRPEFPSALLMPGQTFNRHILFKFSVTE